VALVPLIGTRQLYATRVVFGALGGGGAIIEGKIGVVSTRRGLAMTCTEAGLIAWGAAKNTVIQPAASSGAGGRWELGTKAGRHLPRTLAYLTGIVVFGAGIDALSSGVVFGGHAGAGCATTIVFAVTVVRGALVQAGDEHRTGEVT